ncbi:hypothetical protein ACNKHQ_19495 [Shigella flexneri]
MERGVVIKAAINVFQEVFNGDRRLLAIQLQLDVASRSGQQHVRIGFSPATPAGATAESANTAAMAASVDLSMRIPLTVQRESKWLDSKEG